MEYWYKTKIRQIYMEARHRKSRQITIKYKHCPLKQHNTSLVHQYIYIFQLIIYLLSERLVIYELQLLDYCIIKLCKKTKHSAKQAGHKTYVIRYLLEIQLIYCIFDHVHAQKLVGFLSNFISTFMSNLWKWIGLLTCS